MLCAICCALVMLASHKAAADSVELQPLTYRHIVGWRNDNHAQTFKAFVASCEKPKASNHQLKSWFSLSDITKICAKAQTQPTLSDTQARTFFEAHFAPYRLTTNTAQSGKLTGYYVPIFNGSLVQTERFSHPVYGRPADLIAGTPHKSRAQIEAGALRDKTPIVAWVDDPVMLFFMHVQGSGRLQLPDGHLIELQFNGKNGHPYTAIGNVLVEQEALAKENVSLQSIRQWLYNHPDQAQTIMNHNDSFVFFKLADTKHMPKGAQGVPLTPERSLAIDPAIVPYGLPIYISTHVNNAPYNRLMISQDTGTAIKGAMRGDIFFGQGEQAELKAGTQNALGEWIVLLPGTNND